MGVCENCIGGPDLKSFIRDNLECDYCDHCDTTAVQIAAEFDTFMEYFMECVCKEYTDPANEMTYITKEGGYQGTTYESDELLYELGLDVSCQALWNDISGYMGHNYWCQIDHRAPTLSESYDYGWDSFKRSIMYQRRYTFWNDTGAHDGMSIPDPPPPAHMLGTISRVLSNTKVWKTLPAHTRFFRAIIRDSQESPVIPDRFTSSPREFASQPNRMSPAGIPMFYGCEDRHTTAEEIIDFSRTTDKSISCVEFENLVSLNILDLIELPELPGFFSPTESSERHTLMFLDSFAQDISKAIERGDRQQVDYVPTQVFTEFVRYEVNTPNNGPIHGIQFRSSKNGKKCFVIFADQDDCMDRAGEFRFRPQMLSYVENSYRSALLDVGRVQDLVWK